MILKINNTFIGQDAELYVVGPTNTVQINLALICKLALEVQAGFIEHPRAIARGFRQAISPVTKS